MKSLIFTIFLLGAQVAFANSVVFPPGSMRDGDIISKVEANCADENAKSTQCQGWAAILKNESKSLLLILQNSRNPKNVAIFEQAVTLQDSGIRSIALGYLARVKDSKDQGLIDSALDAMFTRDSFLGNIAAKILESTSIASYEEVGKQFNLGHDSELYSDSSKYNDLFANELFLSTSEDFQDIYFANQEHCVALDRHHLSYYSEGMGGLGFLVANPMAEIIAYYKMKTGLNPAPSLENIILKITALNVEIQKISDQIQHGDFSQFQKLQNLMIEIQSLIAQQLQWNQVGVSGSLMHDANAFFIMDPADPKILIGAIIIKDWQVYQKTSIQYFNKFETITDIEH